MKKCLALILALLLALPLPALGVEQQDDFFLRKKNLGSCRELTGEIPLYVIFAAEKGHPWDAARMDQCKKAVEDAASYLKEQAAGYGRSLSLSPAYYMAEGLDHIDAAEYSQVMEQALQQAGLPPQGENSFYLENEIPLLMILNREGRAFSISDSHAAHNDYLVCYATTASSSYAHELLHLYGARDYYYPDDYHGAAQAYFPDSLMLNSTKTASIDSLTAYIIGWTDQLDEAALSFLRDTAHITQEDYSQAIHDAGFTGYRIKEYDDQTYIGQWETGSWHGNGVVIWDGGTLYTGQFRNGKKDGYGVLVWADGTIYRGQWADDQRTGQGSIFWKSGASYTGAFLNGKLHGYGVYIDAEGTVFEGNWLNDAFQGK